jgi:hypothetical protein
MGAKGTGRGGSIGCGVSCTTRILNGELWESGWKCAAQGVNLQLACGLSACAAPKAPD